MSLHGLDWLDPGVRPAFQSLALSLAFIQREPEGGSKRSLNEFAIVPAGEW